MFDKKPRPAMATHHAVTTHHYWTGLKAYLAMVGLLLIPQVAAAQGAMPWESTLQYIINVLTGNTARFGAIIAVIVLGFLAFIGKLRMGLVGAVIGGIVLIFGSATIVDLFIGSVGN